MKVYPLQCISIAESCTELAVVWSAFTSGVFTYCIPSASVANTRFVLTHVLRQDSTVVSPGHFNRWIFTALHLEPPKNVSKGRPIYNKIQEVLKRTNSPDFPT